MNRNKRAALLRRGLRHEELESRSLLAALVGDSPWQNPLEAHDLDCDGAVSPSDALVAINAINSGVSGDLSATMAPPQLHGQFLNASYEFLDADGDGSLSPSDPLTIINALNANLSELGHHAPVTDQPGMIDQAFVLDVTHGFARVRGVILDGADIDYFKVRPTKSELNVALFSRGSGTLKLVIVDLTETNKFAEAEIEGGTHRPAKVNLDVEPGVPYYLKVTGEGGPYALAVLNFDELTFTPQTDSPLGTDIHKDTTENPTALTLNRGYARVVSNIDSGTDADVFAVAALDGKLLVGAHAEFDLNIEISDADGVLKSLTASNRQATAISVTAGTYFIKVAAANSTDTGAYRMHVGNVPWLHGEGGENELPDDHPAREVIENLFERVDADRDGSVSSAEFESGVPFGRTRIADHVFATWDSNNDQALSLDEVVAGMSTLPPLLPHLPDNDGPGPLRRVLGLRLDGR